MVEATSTIVKSECTLYQHSVRRLGAVFKGRSVPTGGVGAICSSRSVAGAGGGSSCLSEKGRAPRGLAVR